MRILLGTRSDRAGMPSHETVADLNEALALLRSRFAPNWADRRPGPH